MTKKNKPSKQKIAKIVDKPVVWKNLKDLNGESFLLKVNPKYKGCEYIIENNYKEVFTILSADDKGKVLSWKHLSNEPIENEGYEIE